MSRILSTLRRSALVLMALFVLVSGNEASAVVANQSSAGLRSPSHAHPPRSHSGNNSDDINRRVTRLQLRLARYAPQTQPMFWQHSERFLRMRGHLPENKK